MPGQVEKGWALQRLVGFAYLVLGFVFALGAGAWSVPGDFVDTMLRHAHTLQAMAAASWDPAAVRSWFALMLALAVVWTVPTSLALARGAVPRGLGRVIMLGLPTAAFCLLLAWVAVDGLGLWLPEMAQTGSGRIARAVHLVVGGRSGLGMYGSLLMYVATVLASMPFAALFNLARARPRQGSARLGGA
jgi:hypothetical protein